MRSCPECETPILGRADKKFCSDMCRNAYNNKLNSDSNNIVRNINNALRKNRRILEEICISEKTKINKNNLLEKGFDFGFLTSLRKTLKGHIYHFVYEYGYLELENDLYLVVKDNRYKD
ncbi:hypothetical protein GVN16_19000 [Emticicia sp. CRIBPO]|uniref:hypothetical protein n=1 Tax=Emticicia sp. CRIBPO TaxID=2683258 RepID=UPI0014131A5E|nr:hypothetical protein [Emticicia sp. CRIBPO]NBA87865.1 hypothetical protein [Emticicia sp. CRIBPO]